MKNMECPSKVRRNFGHLLVGGLLLWVLYSCESSLEWPPVAGDGVVSLDHATPPPDDWGEGGDDDDDENDNHGGEDGLRNPLCLSL